ncbi:zeta toxin family protein [Paenibacillus sp. MWE-103]|uniref:Zeta toxin family protein n=1 Tax=Paenibacillus artemisiicola TaxID=1172618 RepID=A0ABS3WH09_9BACL|nr:AAA family ATPase [Paenibacillus artemisiicola]MBO7747603.1 zeta toxin family protein [Paenibacillus artemisiicola]
MNDRMPVIYLLSGPPGAGKSTTSRAIAERLERSALIDGDDVYHMVAGGNRAPWESPFHVGLMWRNIGALARNFAATGHDVVVNYVVFREDIALFRAALGETAGLAALKFALLVAEEGELRRRDAERPPELRMGERCGMLADHAGSAHALDTTALTLDQAVETILREDRFVVE